MAYFNYIRTGKSNIIFKALKQRRNIIFGRWIELSFRNVDRVKATYGEKYDPLMMLGSKRDVANF